MNGAMLFDAEDSQNADFVIEGAVEVSSPGAGPRTCACFCVCKLCQVHASIALCHSRKLRLQNVLGVNGRSRKLLRA